MTNKLYSATLLMLFILFTGFSSYAQSTIKTFNKVLADSLGADDYGMKQYILVLLKTGSATYDKKTTDSLFTGHMNNIGRLAAEGKMIVAGTLQKNPNNYRGIFILNVQTQQAASELLLTDPAIKSKLLAYETYGWYGSAALPLYLNYHDQVKKKSF